MALLSVVALTLPKHRQQSVAEQRAAAERQERQLVEEKQIWHTVVARPLQVGKAGEELGGNDDVEKALALREPGPARQSRRGAKKRAQGSPSCEPALVEALKADGTYRTSAEWWRTT